MCIAICFSLQLLASKCRKRMGAWNAGDLPSPATASSTLEVSVKRRKRRGVDQTTEWAIVLDRHLSRFVLELLYNREHPRRNWSGHLKTFALAPKKKYLRASSLFSQPGVLLATSELPANSYSNFLPCCLSRIRIAFRESMPGPSIWAL